MPSLLQAQTTVTGTILDPNSNPYANGTASAFTVVNTGQQSITFTPVSTNNVGAFSITVTSNLSYIFTICAPPTQLGPTANPTPPQVCFSNSLPIFISGGSQDISTPMNAVAKVLGPKLTTVTATNLAGPGTISGTLSGNATLTGVLCQQQLGNFVGDVQVVGCGTNTTIQLAINALPLSGGKVLIPPGTYAMSDSTLNRSGNVEIVGSGNGTVITPSGGSGHYAFILGDASQSTVFPFKLMNLQIVCPGDATSGVLVRNLGFAATDIEKLKIRGCATDIAWGVNDGGAEGAFGGTIQDCDLGLNLGQIGISVTGGVNGSNGLNIVRNFIRTVNLDSTTAIGIQILGPAFRTVIDKNYIEFLGGGEIVLRTTNGTVERTTVTNNYMETGFNEVLLDVGTGVTNTVFENNYTNEVSGPSNYALRFANGATGFYIAQNSFNAPSVAFINNLNTNTSASIIWYDNVALGAAPIFDAAFGITVQSYIAPGGGVGFSTLQQNPVMSLQATNSGAGKRFKFLEPTVGAAFFNWVIGAQIGSGNSYEITPSTTVGGGTYSNPGIVITTTDGAAGHSTVGIPGALVASGPAAGLTGTGACLTITTIVGGTWAGNATCTGVTGASTLIITPGTTAPHAWQCDAADTTTTANKLTQVAPLSATTCTVSGTVNANDVITFKGVSY
jgi:hypothetical protein